MHMRMGELPRLDVVGYVRDMRVCAVPLEGRRVTPASDWPLALTVACPTCGERAGLMCGAEAHGSWVELQRPHAARLRAAREKGERDDG